MKNALTLFLILLLISCKGKVQNDSIAEKVFQIDTLATAEVLDIKTDTLTLISKPFQLNNLMCYWTHFLQIYHYENDRYGLDIAMQLKNSKTDETIFEYEFSPKYVEDYDYKSESYFDSINKKHFKDMNFDGLQDFTIYDYGSMPMTSATVIYVFNGDAKKFETSDLSDTIIEERDSINKILTTSSWDMEANYTKKHHFDSRGKIKFTELITEIFKENGEHVDTLKFIKVHYQKIINNNIVEERIDRVKND